MSETLNYSESAMAKRVKLSDLVPLEKPFTVNLCTSNVCNLKCEYCTFSKPEIRKSKAEISKNGLMSMELFVRVIDDIKKSFGHLKQLVFSGCGEPLINTSIVEMIRYASECDIADRIDVLTNGVLLKQGLSDQLTSSGLTYLRISLNGLSDDDFKKYTGVNVDFEKYVNQLRYFYNKRGNTQVYVKIMNYMVEQPERRKLFYDIFSPICDIINIENLHSYGAGGNGVDYTKITNGQQLTGSKYFDKKFDTKICSVPFYYLMIDSDGSVYPCCEGITDNRFASVGNVQEKTLVNIWSENVIPFQQRMLDGRNGMFYCETCPSAYAWVHPEDILDNDADKIKERYNRLRR